MRNIQENLFNLYIAGLLSADDSISPHEGAADFLLRGLWEKAHPSKPLKILMCFDGETEQNEWNDWSVRQNNWNVFFRPSLFFKSVVGCVPFYSTVFWIFLHNALVCQCCITKLSYTLLAIGITRRLFNCASRHASQWNGYINVCHYVNNVVYKNFMLH